MTRSPEDDLATAVRRPVAPATSVAEGFVVEVVEGPDRGARALVDGALEQPLLVGQSPACGLKLSDPSVSRRHLSLELEGGALRVLDLASTNGTYLRDAGGQGLRVRDVSCVGGERLVLGATTLELTAVDRGRRVVPSELEEFGRVLGRSPAMKRLFPLFSRVAASSVPCVIEGETGTGKELLAEALHDAGPRRDGPFVVFDCTAVPGDLIEAALFGHEKGAFTGAVQQRKGVFEQADGGTLLIDEIGDLELPLQAKLLRAIERSEVRRVGGDAMIKVDARILAATRRDLDREVAAGRFRDDLFYRLAVARVELPPLRKREGDVDWLASVFWKRLAGDRPMPAGLVQHLAASDFPGNVRELSNTVARWAALGELAVTMSSAPEPEKQGALESVASQVIAAGLPLVEARRRVVENFERAYLESMLARHGGNVRAAASAAGIARRWFQIIRARQRGGE